MDTIGNIINIRRLKDLATDFGLPCIENATSLTVVGEKQWLVFSKQQHMFNKSEETKCQLIEIY